MSEGERTDDRDAARAELDKLLDSMQPTELHAIQLMLEKAHSWRPEGVDLPTLVHSVMRSTWSDAGAMSYDELSVVKAPPVMRAHPGRTRIPLPARRLPLDHTLDQVIGARASRRDYTHHVLPLAQFATLLGASYGVKKHIMAYNTRDFPVRMSPSQGGLQSVELYVIANRVESVPRGLYSYYAQDNCLIELDRGNLSQKIVHACIFQDYVEHASAVLVLAVSMEKIEWKYGVRGYRFAHADAGVLASYIYLVATSLRLRTTAIAAFYDDEVNDLLGVDGRSEFAALVMPLGTRPDWSAADE